LIEAVLLDLGNVVILSDNSRAAARLAGHSRSGVSAADVGELIGPRGFGTDLETGRLTPREFFRAIRERAALELDYDRFVGIWTDIFDEPDGGRTLEVLRNIARAVPLYAASNTDPVHVAQVRRRYPEYLSVFRRLFLSYELELAKPDVRFFSRAADGAGVEPARAYFTDDLVENVAAARAAGLVADVYRGPERLVLRLKELGVPLGGAVDPGLAGR
jgi:putative hydrolase of the HAD superfamily